MSILKEHFLEEVLHYIKSKEAKGLVRKELSYHINMAKVELLSKGLNEKEAEEKAIKQMGSPTELGTQFNKLYRPIFDWKLFALFVFILSMGILPTINLEELYAQNLLVKQIINIVLGVIVTIIAMLIDYRKIKKLGWIFLITALGLLLSLNFFPNLVINGSSYIHLFGFTISGITLMPLFLVFWASYLSNEKPKIMIVIGVYLFSTLLFLGLTFPEVIIYSVLVFTLLVFSSMKKKVIYTTFGISFGLLLSLVLISWFTMKTYQKERILAFLNPDDFAQTSGYFYLYLRDLLSKGGWFGNQDPPRFLGAELTTDMAFANITYFYGWLLAGILVVILTLLLIRMVVVSTQIKERFGKQLILGVCALLSIQIVYNIGMIIGLFPLMSMSLPFISYGLTPTVLNSLLIGFVLSVYRRKHLLNNSESIVDK